MISGNKGKQRTSIMLLLIIIITVTLGVFVEGKTANQELLTSIVPTAGAQATSTPAMTAGVQMPTSAAGVTKQELFSIKEVDGGICITDYSGKKKKVVIPEEYDGKEVVELYTDEVFGGVKEIIIPKTIRRIHPDEDGSYFYGASKMEKIKVDKANPVYKSVKGMLIDKKKKELLEVPSASSIKKLVVSKGIERIHQYAICGSNIRSLTIGKKIKKMHPYAGGGNPLIFKLLGEVKVINERQYFYMTKLKKLVLREGIKKIKSQAFCGSRKLKKVVIPKSVKYLAKDAFPKTCKVIRK